MATEAEAAVVSVAAAAVVVVVADSIVTEYMYRWVAFTAWNSIAIRRALPCRYAQAWP